MLKRFLNPLQIAALVSISIVLTLALMWIFNNPQSQPQRGQTIQITPAHTRALRHTVPASLGETATLVQATHTLTLAPETDTPTPEPLVPSPTPRPTARPTVDARTSAFTLKEELWSNVDLNCDGLDERLVKINVYTDVYNKTNFQLTLGLILQVPSQASYRQAWTYICPLRSKLYKSSDCVNVKIALLAINDCEQLVTFMGQFEGEDHLLIFRWNGQDMSVVLDARANSYSATQDPLILTTTLERCESHGKCEKKKTEYVWNGSEFE